jgi:hypothetical protein
MSFEGFFVILGIENVRCQGLAKSFEERFLMILKRIFWVILRIRKEDF